MQHEVNNTQIIFKSARNGVVQTLLWCFVIGFIILLAIPKDIHGGELAAFFIILSPITAMLLWILLDTKYIIKDGKLHYYSGPIRGKINISNIRKIEKNNTFFKTSSLKPGLARRGFVIHYNKFDDIFLSPEDRDGFVKLLVQLNPEILVI